MEDQKVLEKVDECIINVCKKINSEDLDMREYADTVKALAELVEARAKLYY